MTCVSRAVGLPFGLFSLYPPYSNIKAPLVYRSIQPPLPLLLTMELPKTYNAYVFTETHGDLQHTTVNWEEPASNEVVVKVLACGVCAGYIYTPTLFMATNSKFCRDEIVKDQVFPTGLPRIPGHEIVGDVVSVGSGVTSFKIGDRVGSGWHGGHCFSCGPCLRGDFVLCDRAEINGMIICNPVRLLTEITTNVRHPKGRRICGVCNPKG